MIEVMRFADKVRSLLKLRRLSQSELAEALGTTQPQISRWLEGNSPPRWDYLLKMARALGVTADYLIDQEQEELPRPPGLTEDERFLLQLYHDLGLSREDAVRGLAAAARSVPFDAPRPASGPWVPGAVRHLPPGEPRRRHEQDPRSGPRRGPSKREPDRQDEGADPEHTPGRIR
jgi:transcriptional regulator with XRE-family HTH domain